MQSVVVESEAMRANVTDAADVAEASEMFAATEASDVAASDVAAAAKAAAHMAAATEATAKTSAVTTTASAATTGVCCARQQARSEESCCQYRDHPSQRDTPFSVGLFGARRVNFIGARERNVG